MNQNSHMVHDTFGLHHFHRRKRIYQRHEPYPHPNKWKRLMDKLIYVVGIIGPIMTLPQLIEVWFYNSSGVSPITWFTYFLIDIFWLVYGFMHKEKPIIFIYMCWMIVNFLVALGAII